jgi:exopolysaccharide production protein ExoQ
MRKPSRLPPDWEQPEFSASMLDRWMIAVPIAACAFALIVSPLSLHFALNASADTDYLARLFWPSMAAVSIILVMQNHSRFKRLAWPPHILCLFACVAFAGASTLWAFKPESSFIRFLQQVMVVLSVIMPALLADRRTDMMRALFLCFAVASILNVFFVLSGDPIVVRYGAASVNIGYPGYFAGKNYLGECAGLALLLSLHEMLYPRRRRAFAIAVIGIAAILIFLSDSKTALGLAILTPFLAGVALMAARKTRLSPAVILLSIPLCYMVLSNVSNFNVNRLSYMLYGDSTLTGRTIIWDFASSEIARQPLLGWGYQSFWLVGPDAPSVLDAPGWVKEMPNAHNGYYDATLEMGYVGYYLLLIFIIATLHAIGRVAYQDGARAWLLLSVALYFICFNYLESLWMRGFEFLWVVFLIVVAEIGRYRQPLLRENDAYRVRTVAPGGLAARGGQRHTRKFSA